MFTVISQRRIVLIYVTLFNIEKARETKINSRQYFKTNLQKCKRNYIDKLLINTDIPIRVHNVRIKTPNWTTIALEKPYHVP